MKKAISLALVLCMAIACFAFAPTSAEIYRDNLLTVTEENDSIATKGGAWDFDTLGFNTWSHDPADGLGSYSSAEGFFTIVSDSKALYQNNYGNAKAIKIDLSKAIPGDWNFLAYIMPSEIFKADKTYTVFFMAKASSAEITNSKIQFSVGGCNNFTGTDTLVAPASAGNLTTEWSLFKMTFKANPQTGSNGNQVLGDVVAFDIEFNLPEAMAGEIYIDAIGLVEGDTVDADAFYANYRIPLDDDDDRLDNNEDPDLDGDGILNKYDTDMDNDGTKNVWDRDIDNDGIDNKVDDKPFGGQ